MVVRPEDIEFKLTDEQVKELKIYEEDIDHLLKTRFSQSYPGIVSYTIYSKFAYEIIDELERIYTKVGWIVTRLWRYDIQDEWPYRTYELTFLKPNMVQQ